MTGSHGCTTCGAARREKRRSSWPDRLTAARESESVAHNAGGAGAVHGTSMRLIEVMTCRILECMLGRELAHAVAKVPYGEDDALETLTRMEIPLDISEQIQTYIQCIAERMILPDACLVIALIYIERAVLGPNRFGLGPLNWQPTILVVLVIASKVYFDGLIWNEDFVNACQIRNVTPRRISSWERDFLRVLSYKVHVSPNQYAVACLALQALYLDLFGHTCDLFSFLMLPAAGGGSVEVVGESPPWIGTRTASLESQPSFSATSGHSTPPTPPRPSLKASPTASRNKAVITRSDASRDWAQEVLAALQQVRSGADGDGPSASSKAPVEEPRAPCAQPHTWYRQRSQPIGIPTKCGHNGQERRGLVDVETAARSPPTDHEHWYAAVGRMTRTRKGYWDRVIPQYDCS